MPLPRLKITPAELEEQRHKAQRKRRRKHREDPSDFVQGSSTKTLYSEGIGHVDEQLATDEDYEAHRLYQESLDNDMRMNRNYEEELLDPLDADGLTARQRWRSTSSTTPSPSDIGIMDDDTYAKWINSGLYRLGKTVQVGQMNVLMTDHRAMEERKLLIESYLREQKEKEERRLREKEDRRKRRKVEEEQEMLRKQRAIDKRRRDREEALEDYQERWKQLLLRHFSSASQTSPLHFTDIPWPTFTPLTSSASLKSEDIREFVLSSASITSDHAEHPSSLKDVLRPHFLRFHPDKFEGKIMPLVDDSAKEEVREAVGVVMRTLNQMAES